MEELISNSEQETLEIARKFMEDLQKGTNVLCLFGDLGSGKTVFVKGLAQTLSIDSYRVKSPTFTFIREYSHPKGKICHADLYRLNGPDDVLFDQIDELVKDENNLIIIEWAEKMGDRLPKKRTDICFEYINKDSRKITIFK